MNEVEKLYENAGVEKYYCSFESSDGNVYNWELNEDGDEKYNKCFLGKPKIKQRSFTAEKQLELIKWLALRDYITIVAYISGEYHSEHDKYNANENSLEGCLARLINNLWQDLTEADKAQIKEILE